MADRDTPQIASARFEQLKRSERNLGPERFIPYPLLRHTDNSDYLVFSISVSVDPTYLA